MSVAKWLCSILLLVFLSWSGEAYATETYQVQRGDTLSSLSYQWRVKVDAIREANGLTKDDLTIGQKLLIPVSEKKQLPKKKKVSRGGYRDIVALGQRFIGTPYVRSSSNPRVGFDCSGFTQYVHSLAGISLPRSSSEQFNVGSSVARKDLAYGDLVFFNTGGGISHVGIYAGNGDFIHSSSSRGVTVTSLSTSYWGPRYVGAKRVIN